MAPPECPVAGVPQEEYTSGFTQQGMGWPARAASIFSAAISAIFARVVCVALPICGVATTLGRLSSG